MPNWLTDKLRQYTSLDTPQDEGVGDFAAQTAAGFVPGVGQAMALRDFERARRDNDYTGMGLSAVSLIPGGHLVKLLKGGGALAGAKLGLIGGAAAKKAPISAMHDAEILKNAGKDPQAQWDITRKRHGDKNGAFIGHEDVPQFEISDVNSRPIHTETKDMPLSQAFHHPEGYDQYPHLRNDTRVTGTANFQGDPKDLGAKFIADHYGPGQHGIVVNARSPDEYHDWILHEMNHGIAHVEPGFSRGSNPDHIHERLVDHHIDKKLAEGKTGLDAVPDEFMSKALRTKAEKLYGLNIGELNSNAVELRRTGKFAADVPTSHAEHLRGRYWHESDGLPDGIPYR